MIANGAVLLGIFLAFVCFFNLCDSFVKTDANPGKGMLTSIIGGIIAVKAMEVLSRNRVDKNAEKEGRSVVDDINAQKRKR